MPPKTNVVADPVRCLQDKRGKGNNNRKNHPVVQTARLKTETNPRGNETENTQFIGRKPETEMTATALHHHFLPLAGF